MDTRTKPPHSYFPHKHEQVTSLTGVTCDKGIAKIVDWLNSWPGFTTEASCEDDYGKPYVLIGLNFPVSLIKKFLMKLAEFHDYLYPEDGFYPPRVTTEIEWYQDRVRIFMQFEDVWYKDRFEEFIGQ